MSLLKSFILGIIQGITEFFPISSSFHLNVLTKILNFNIEAQFFFLFCHLGTTFSIIFFLRKEILKILLYEKEKLYFITISLIPLLFFYLIFLKIKNFTENLYLLGIFLMITSIFLFFTSYSKDKKAIDNSSLSKKIKDMLFIGTMQALALFPGISRSGFTISAACFRGWNIKEAINFSFLLAIPTILGGTILEGSKMLIYKEIDKNILSINNLSTYVVGFLTSFVAGFFTIKLIYKIENKKKLKPFAWYCLILSAIFLIFLKTL